MSDSELTIRIRRRAYQIWEREGRPDSRHIEHWLKAERELLEESLANEAKPKVKKSRPSAGTKPPGAKPSSRAGARQ